MAMGYIKNTDLLMSFTAGAAITEGQAVKFDANGNVVPAAANDVNIGFAYEDASSGQVVQILLRSEMLAGKADGTTNAIAAGDTLTTGDSGVLVKVTDPTTQTPQFIALEGTSGTAIISVIKY